MREWLGDMEWKKRERKIGGRTESQTLTHVGPRFPNRVQSDPLLVWVPPSLFITPTPSPAGAHCDAAPPSVGTN